MGGEGRWGSGSMVEAEMKERAEIGGMVSVMVVNA